MQEKFQNFESTQTEQRVNSARPPSDFAAPILLCGDLNVNSLAEADYVKKHAMKENQNEQDTSSPEEVSQQIAQVVNEYTSTMNTLSNSGLWTVLDCLEQNKQNLYDPPATFVKST